MPALCTHLPRIFVTLPVTLWLVWNSRFVLKLPVVSAVQLLPPPPPPP